MDEAKAKVVDLNLNDILPNRFQPRIKFNEDSIIELSESIKEHGVIQPVVVRPIGDKYEIIAGERRYKASVLAGKETIPAIITNLDDKDSAEVALIENVQRRDLTAIEEAISYKKILDMGYLTQEQLAIKLGKSQSTIANKVRLLNLCDEAQEALMEEKISERHARSLLRLDSFANQKDVLGRIIEERLTVRKTDEEIDKMNNGQPIEEPKQDINENAFSPFNPGFVDVEKIENQAQEIIPEKKEVDFGALLSNSLNSSIPADIQTVDPFSSGVPPVSINTPEMPETPILENAPLFSGQGAITPIDDDEPALPGGVDAISTVNPFEQSPTFVPVEKEPEVAFVPVPPVVETSFEEVPPIQPVPTEEQEEKKFSFNDLLAPQQESSSVTVSPVLEPTNITPAEIFTTPVEMDLSALDEPEPASVEQPIIPTAPIAEEALPSRFFGGDETLAEEPADDGGAEKVIPLVPEAPVEEEVSVEHIPEEIRPIIVTDYSKQYDPIMPATGPVVEKIDFKKIINLIRDMQATIEKCGYTIDSEEFDLEDTYQVMFKINKK